MKQWGIFCTKNEVNEIVSIVEKNGLDVFEVRPLTYVEALAYVKYPYICVNELCVVMFHATKWQYNWLIFRNKLTKIF